MSEIGFISHQRSPRFENEYVAIKIKIEEFTLHFWIFLINISQ